MRQGTIIVAAVSAIIAYHVHGFTSPITQLQRLPVSTSQFATMLSTNEKRPLDVMNITEIINLLEQTYPDNTSNSSSSSINGKKKWTKTRDYLYQYRASLSPTSSSSSSSTTTTSSSKRKRKGRDPLTLSNIQQIISFLQSTFPNNTALQSTIIQKSPRILGQYHSIDSRLVPTVEFLNGLYGNMGTNDDMFVEAISRNTNLLLLRGVGYNAAAGRGRGGEGDGSSNDNMNREVEEYLQNDLDMPSSAIVKLKRNHPKVFQLSLKDKVKPAIKYLHSLLGHNNIHEDVLPASMSARQLRKKVAKIVSCHPQVLQLDVASNLEPTTCFLRDACDFTDTELGQVIFAAPGVLGLSVEENLKPTLQLIEDILKSSVEQEVGGNEDDGDCSNFVVQLRKCILRHPQILALSLNNLRAKRDYFNSIGSSSDESSSMVEDNKGTESTEKRKPSLAARILQSAPSVYSLSLEGNIIPKVEYLSTTLWGSSFNMLSENIHEYPPIMTLSLEDNIIPTISFYNMTGFLAVKRIRGRYVATSLYKRLLPRWHFMLQEQEKQQKQQLEQLESLVTKAGNDGPKYNITTSTTSSTVILPPLHLLAGASDDNFCRQMKLSLNDFQAFKDEAGPRLKFSSQFDRWLKTGRAIDLTTTEAIVEEHNTN